MVADACTTLFKEASTASDGLYLSAIFKVSTFHTSPSFIRFILLNAPTVRAESKIAVPLLLCITVCSSIATCIPLSRVTVAFVPSIVILFILEVNASRVPSSVRMSSSVRTSPAPVTLNATFTLVFAPKRVFEARSVFNFSSEAIVLPDASFITLEPSTTISLPFTLTVLAAATTFVRSPLTEPTPSESDIIWIFDTFH